MSLASLMKRDLIGSGSLERGTNSATDRGSFCLGGDGGGKVRCVGLGNCGGGKGGGQHPQC